MGTGICLILFYYWENGNWNTATGITNNYEKMEILSGLNVHVGKNYTGWEMGFWYNFG